MKNMIYYSVSIPKDTALAISKELESQGIKDYSLNYISLFKIKGEENMDKFNEMENQLKKLFKKKNMKLEYKFKRFILDQGKIFIEYEISQSARLFISYLIYLLAYLNKKYIGLYDNGAVIELIGQTTKKNIKTVSSSKFNIS